MKPDTITVRIRLEEELDADSADLTVAVEGSSVFSGSEAFKKAKELKALTDALKQAGVEEGRIKLRSVEVNSQSFAGLKTSSAKYVFAVKRVSIEMLSPVLGLISSHKGAKLTYLQWNYDRLNEIRRKLRGEAIEEALAQARLDAKRLGVALLGIWTLGPRDVPRDYNDEFVQGYGNASFSTRSRKVGVEDIGFQLGNSTTVSLDFQVEFRIGPLELGAE